MIQSNRGRRASTRPPKLLIALILLSASAFSFSDSRLDSAVTIFSESGHGSGVIVDGNGVIYTNYHVIEDSKSLAIKLSNGDVFVNVDLLAQDELRDIAILKVSGYDLPVAPLGNSNTVSVGDKVSVVGAPEGLTGTISSGIVSAKRRVEGRELIQIDAAISPGSSGGAVFDAEGRVIALAVSQYVEGQNLNFAVPINYARGLDGSRGETTTFASGENLLLTVPTNISGGDLASTETLSKVDIVEIASLALGSDFAGPDADGDYFAERDSGGNIWLVFDEDDAFYLSIYWSLDSVVVDKEFFAQLLRLNFRTKQVSVGLYNANDEKESLWVGLEGNTKWIRAKELSAAVNELVAVDKGVLDLLLANIPDETAIALIEHQSRPSFAKPKRSVSGKKIAVMKDEFSIRVPRSWKVYQDQELGSAGGRMRNLANRDSTLEIALLEEIGDIRIDDTLLLEIAEGYAGLAVDETGQMMVLSRGERFVKDFRVVWLSVVVKNDGDMPTFYEFNMFPDVTNLFTVLTSGESLEEVIQLGTDVIKSLE